MECSRRKFRPAVRAVLCLSLAVSAIGLAELNDRSAPPLDHPAIRYRSWLGSDPVGVLDAKLRLGTTQLKFDGPQGYLRSVLDALKVPIESQVAVFSKTSQQFNLISPRNPRTIF